MDRTEYMNKILSDPNIERRVEDWISRKEEINQASVFAASYNTMEIKPFLATLSDSEFEMLIKDLNIGIPSSTHTIDVEYQSSQQKTKKDLASVVPTGLNEGSTEQQTTGCCMEKTFKIDVTSKTNTPCPVEVENQLSQDDTGGELVSDIPRETIKDRLQGKFQFSSSLHSLYVFHFEKVWLLIHVAYKVFQDMKIAKKCAESPFTIVTSLYKRGIKALDSSQYIDALNIFNRCLEFSPTNDAFLGAILEYSSGCTYLLLKQNVQAIVTFENAIQKIIPSLCQTLEEDNKLADEIRGALFNLKSNSASVESKVRNFALSELLKQKETKSQKNEKNLRKEKSHGFFAESREKGEEARDCLTNMLVEDKKKLCRFQYQYSKKNLILVLIAASHSNACLLSGNSDRTVTVLQYIRRCSKFSENEHLLHQIISVLLARIFTLQGNTKQAKEILVLEDIDNLQVQNILEDDSFSPLSFLFIEEMCRILAYRGEREKSRKVLDTALEVCEGVYSKQHPQVLCLNKTIEELFPTLVMEKASLAFDFAAESSIPRLNVIIYVFVNYALQVVNKDRDREKLLAELDVMKAKFSNEKHFADRYLSEKQLAASTQSPEVTFISTLCVCAFISKQGKADNKTEICLENQLSKIRTLCDVLPETLALETPLSFLSDYNACIISALCSLLDTALLRKAQSIAKDIYKLLGSYLSLTKKRENSTMEWYKDYCGLLSYFIIVEEIDVSGNGISLYVIVTCGSGLDRIKDDVTSEFKPLFRRIVVDEVSEEYPTFPKETPKCFVFLRSHDLIDIFELRRIKQNILESIKSLKSFPATAYCRGNLLIEVLPEIIPSKLSNLCFSLRQLKTLLVDIDEATFPCPAEALIAQDLFLQKFQRKLTFKKESDLKVFVAVFEHTIEDMETVDVLQKERKKTVYCFDNPSFSLLVLDTQASDLYLQLQKLQEVGSQYSTKNASRDDTTKFFDNIIKDCSDKLNIKCTNDPTNDWYNVGGMQSDDQKSPFAESSEENDNEDELEKAQKANARLTVKMKYLETKTQKLIFRTRMLFDQLSDMKARVFPFQHHFIRTICSSEDTRKDVETWIKDRNGRKLAGSEEAGYNEGFDMEEYLMSLTNDELGEMLANIKRPDLASFFSEEESIDQTIKLPVQEDTDDTLLGSFGTKISCEEEKTEGAMVATSLQKQHYHDGTGPSQGIENENDGTSSWHFPFPLNTEDTKTLNKANKEPQSPILKEEFTQTNSLSLEYEVKHPHVSVEVQTEPLVDEDILKIGSADFERDRAERKLRKSTMLRDYLRLQKTTPGHSRNSSYIELSATSEQSSSDSSSGIFSIKESSRDTDEDTAGRRPKFDALTSVSILKQHTDSTGNESSGNEQSLNESSSDINSMKQTSQETLESIASQGSTLDSITSGFIFAQNNDTETEASINKQSFDESSSDINNIKELKDIGLNRQNANENEHCMIDLEELQSDSWSTDNIKDDNSDWIGEETVIQTDLADNDLQQDTNTQEPKKSENDESLNENTKVVQLNGESQEGQRGYKAGLGVGQGECHEGHREGHKIGNKDHENGYEEGHEEFQEIYRESDGQEESLVDVPDESYETTKQRNLLFNVVFSEMGNRKVVNGSRESRTLGSQDLSSTFKKMSKVASVDEANVQTNLACVKDAWCEDVCDDGEPSKETLQLSKIGSQRGTNLERVKSDASEGKQRDVKSTVSMQSDGLEREQHDNKSNMITNQTESSKKKQSLNIKKFTRNAKTKKYNSRVVCDEMQSAPHNNTSNKVVCDGMESAPHNIRSNKVVCDGMESIPHDIRSNKVVCDGMESAPYDIRSCKVVCDGMESASPDIRSSKVVCDGMESAPHDIRSNKVVCDGMESAPHDIRSNKVVCDGLESAPHNIRSNKVVCGGMESTPHDIRSHKVVCGGMESAPHDIRSHKVVCGGMESAPHDIRSSKLICDGSENPDLELYASNVEKERTNEITSKSATYLQHSLTDEVSAFAFIDIYPVKESSSGLMLSLSNDTPVMDSLTYEGAEAPQRINPRRDELVTGRKCSSLPTSSKSENLCSKVNSLFDGECVVVHDNQSDCEISKEHLLKIRLNKENKDTETRNEGNHVLNDKKAENVTSSFGNSEHLSLGSLYNSPSSNSAQSTVDLANITVNTVDGSCLNLRIHPVQIHPTETPHKNEDINLRSLSAISEDNESRVWHSQGARPKNVYHGPQMNYRKDFIVSGLSASFLARHSCDSSLTMTDHKSFLSLPVVNGIFPSTQSPTIARTIDNDVHGTVLSNYHKPHQSSTSIQDLHCQDNLMMESYATEYRIAQSMQSPIARTRVIGNDVRGTVLSIHQNSQQNTTSIRDLPPEKTEDLPPNNLHTSSNGTISIYQESKIGEGVMTTKEQRIPVDHQSYLSKKLDHDGKMSLPTNNYPTKSKPTDRTSFYRERQIGGEDVMMTNGLPADRQTNIDYISKDETNHTENVHEIGVKPEENLRTQQTHNVSTYTPLTSNVSNLTLPSNRNNEHEMVNEMSDSLSAEQSNSLSSTESYATADGSLQSLEDFVANSKMTWSQMSESAVLSNETKDQYSDEDYQPGSIGVTERGSMLAEAGQVRAPRSHNLEQVCENENKSKRESNEKHGKDQNSMESKETLTLKEDKFGRGNGRIRGRESGQQGIVLFSNIDRRETRGRYEHQASGFSSTASQPSFQRVSARAQEFQERERNEALKREREEKRKKDKEEIDRKLTARQERERAETPSTQQPRHPVQETAVEWPCEHYKRKCEVKFPCCNQFFSCHRCHNNSKQCDKDDKKALDATHLRCLVCRTEQEITEDSHHCKNKNCTIQLAEYFCGVCKHFTGNDKTPYHCKPCGICRIHKDRSFHCDVCNVCLDKRLLGKHKCRPDSGHDECCICLEDAFSGCQILPCSHKVHRECAVAMIKNGVRKCPVCRYPLYE